MFLGRRLAHIQALALQATPANSEIPLVIAMYVSMSTTFGSVDMGLISRCIFYGGAVPLVVAWRPYGTYTLRVMSEARSQALLDENTAHLLFRMLGIY